TLRRGWSISRERQGGRDQLQHHPRRQGDRQPEGFSRGAARGWTWARVRGNGRRKIADVCVGPRSDRARRADYTRARTRPRKERLQVVNARATDRAKYPVSNANRGRVGDDRPGHDDGHTRAVGSFTLAG